MSKFVLDCNFLVRKRESFEINPQQFLHCATIQELHNEVEDFLYSKIEFPNNYGEESELLGYYNNSFNTFYEEWQQLKNLPKEL